MTEENKIHDAEVIVVTGPEAETTHTGPEGEENKEPAVEGAESETKQEPAVEGAAASSTEEAVA